VARRARALAQLLAEVNVVYQLRDTSSDGWIGDPAHASRPSDHNPNAAGHVRAQDFDEDHDPGDEQIGPLLWSFLLARRDPRLSYVIYERQMFSSYPTSGHPAWAVRPYTGPNGHLHHLHVSVSDDPALYDDPAPWGFAPEEDPMPAALTSGETGGQVVDWLLRLAIACALRGVSLDGLDFGHAVETATYTGAAKAAVNRYRDACGLPQTGVYDYSVLARVVDDLAHPGGEPGAVPAHQHRSTVGDVIT